MDRFKRFFKRGLGALAPTLVTIALLMWAYRFVDENIGRHITELVVSAYAWRGPPETFFGIDDETALRLGDPIDEWDATTGRRLTTQYKVLHSPGLASRDAEIRKQAAQAERDALWDLVTRKWKFFNVIGFVIGIFLIYLTGYFLASFVGRKTWSLLEGAVRRLPLIGGIYPSIKQVTDLLIAERSLDFTGVVAVQYPRKGLWSVGLVTGPAMKQVSERDDRELLTVFIPSSPTPFTGYTVTVAATDVLELPLTIDEAFRYTVSGGILRPGEQVATGSLPSEL